MVFFVLQAHENAIKCIAMDPHEEVLITGSADGDIRVIFNLIKLYSRVFFCLWLSWHASGYSCMLVYDMIELRRSLETNERSVIFEYLHTCKCLNITI